MVLSSQWSTFFIVIAILMQVISCSFFASGALCRKSFYTSHTKHSGMAATVTSLYYQLHSNVPVTQYNRKSRKFYHFIQESTVLVS
jgi:hypothetical protein